MTQSEPGPVASSDSPVLAEVVEPVDANVAKLPDKPQWLHPTSLFFEFTSGIRKQLVPAIFAVYTAAQWGEVGLIIAIVFFAFTMVYAIVQFVTTRYQVRGDDLIIDEGLIFRRHRTIPVHRIQNIDLMQSILHRMFGVAEVRIETASGKEPEAKLRVLSLHRVEELRTSVFQRERQSQGIHVGPAIEGAAKVTAPLSADIASERLLAIPQSLLIKAGLLSNRGLVLVAVAAGALYQFFPWENGFVKRMDLRDLVRFLPWDQVQLRWIFAVLGLIVVLLFLKLLSVVWYILRFHGYVLERRGEELRIRCGLFSRLSATVPRRRIQLISIQRTWLGKAMGIASIRIETAGGSGSESEGDTSSISRRWFIPVLPEQDVTRLVSVLHPGIEWDENKIPWIAPSPQAADRLRRWALFFGIVVTAVATWFLSWPGIAVGIAFSGFAWWYAGKKAAVMRYARGAFGLAYRSGLITKKCSLTFLDKVQSVWLSESPFDRRWKMATLCIDTAGSGPAEHQLHIHLLEAGFARSERQAIAKHASETTIEFG
jgi:putative membrane protein